MIREITNNDCPAIAEIYNHYVTNTVITFELTPVSADTIHQRVEKVRQLSLPWLVAEGTSGEILGYAYANQWKERLAYQHSVEVTIYLAHNRGGNGIGSRLYQALFDALKQREIHAALGVIALPNDASVALHEKFGMKKVAHFEEVGRKFDRWIDVGYWQSLL